MATNFKSKIRISRHNQCLTCDIFTDKSSPNRLHRMKIGALEAIMKMEVTVTSKPSIHN